MKEDFPGAPSWIENFIRLLNKFKDQAEQLFDKKLNITDNMNAGIFDLDLNTQGGVASALPAGFKFTAGKPRVVLCGGCWDVTGEETPVVAPGFAWSYDTDTVTVTALTGLAPDRKYKLTFVVFVD